MINKLIELNFKIGDTGFIYLMEAIKLKKENILMSIGKIYEAIAVKYNTTNAKVERALSYMKTKSDNKYKDYKIHAMIMELALIL